MRPVKPTPPLTPDAIAETAATIVAVQEPDGAIPWYPGGHTDPWDHLECAMALRIAGRPDTIEAVDAAWEWIRHTQRDDGSWATSYVAGQIKDDFADSNQCAYVATAAWHSWLATGDRSFLRRMWPVVRAALDFVVGLQAAGGQIWWARSADGTAYPEALLTGCSSTLHSLRCGLGLAAALGEAVPRWEAAAGALHHALRDHPERFVDKRRWSMDWYYPVIGGALRGPRGRDRLRSRWDDFVVDGLGARCVADQPWVTGAETCELAIALHLVGESGAAAGLLEDIQFLRHNDGSYWTGWQFAEKLYWPPEQSTWTAAAVLLAVDSLTGGVTEAVFRGDGLPARRSASGPGAVGAAAIPLGCSCGRGSAGRPPENLRSGSAFEDPQRSRA